MALTAVGKSEGCVMSNCDEMEAFWQAALAAVPELIEARGYVVKRFGNNPAMANQLLDLVASGQKTGTFALLTEFQDRGVPAPAAGDQVIVTDGEGHPGCLYVIDHTEILPFDDITDRHVACEGPRLRELQPWRELHWQFWSELLADTPHQPANDMAVVYQRFRCLYPATGN